MDAGSLLQSIGAAVAGGLGSFLSALHTLDKKYKETQAELDAIKTSVKALGDDSVRISSTLAWKQSLESELRLRAETLVVEKFDALRRGFRVEMDDFKEAIERKFRDFDRQPTRPDTVTLEELRRQQDNLGRKIDELRKDQSDYEEGQAKQWNEMNRTLGQIQGEMKRVTHPPR